MVGTVSHLAVEPVSSVTCGLGEAPFWSPSNRQLLWVDWLHDLLHRLDFATGEVRTWDVGERIGTFALRKRGGAVLALESGFSFFDFETGETRHLLHPDPANPGPILNDGKCDRRGRLVAGSLVAPLADLPKDREKAATAGLFALDANLKCRVLRRGILITNGVAWSPDDRTLYYADSGRGVIYSTPYDIDTGAVGISTVFAVVEPPGVPDGATVDSAGYLWTAIFNGSRLVRYAPDGSVDRVIGLPVRQPTGCTFGGDALDTLFVTTARYRLPPSELDRQPLAGRLLALRPGVAGIADSMFSG